MDKDIEHIYVCMILVQDSDLISKYVGIDFYTAEGKFLMEC